MFLFSVPDVQFYTLCGNSVKRCNNAVKRGNNAAQRNAATGEHGTGAYRGWWWFYTPQREGA
jgi:hypothetical protein